MVEESDRGMKWVLAVSLILFFGSPWVMTVFGYLPYQYRQQGVAFTAAMSIFFIMTPLFAVLHTMNFKKELTYQFTIGFFILAMSCFVAYLLFAAIATLY